MKDILDSVKAILHNGLVYNFLETYADTYEYLYENKIDTYDEAVLFDELSKDETFIELVRAAASARGDIFSSDRECAAFILALEKY